MWAEEAGRDPDKLGFVKQHNISVDADPAVAEKNAYAHWRNYYGPRWDISSAVIGNVEQAAEQLAAFKASDVPEITLALEPSSLDLKHLEQVWEASKGLR
jgi:alkanesulfonate monooxygenase SsuD/methylene tetrahydromethanopterin reductase-like flavin-dependent oxidoreductase (luciferase family)